LKAVATLRRQLSYDFEARAIGQQRAAIFQPRTRAACAFEHVRRHDVSFGVALLDQFQLKLGEDALDGAVTALRPETFEMLPRGIEPAEPAQDFSLDKP
jgi:hypothetical protein